MPAESSLPIHILLIEDDPGDVLLTTETLRQSKVANEVHTVSDGVAAMAFLRREAPFQDAPRPDLVLLDFGLPRKDGREVLQEIKGDPSFRTIPVVVLTASTSDEDVARAYIHANAYVPKPVDVGRFLEVVKGIDEFFVSVVRLPREGLAGQDEVERQLRQAQRLESLGQLAGGVAHDFNNLLTAVVNYADFLQEGIDQAEQGAGMPEWESMRSDVAQIKVAADRATRLTKQLLKFARREVTKPTVININQVIRDLEPLVRRTLGEHVELMITLDPNLRPVLADPGGLEQVLVNLLVNARDAMSGGGRVTVETSNTQVIGQEPSAAGPLQPGPYVELTVRDSGTGIPDEAIDRIFDPFFTTKTPDAGTGLGLSTVYGIVAQSGGRVDARSEPGMGAAFTVVLPAVEPSARGTPSSGDQGANVDLEGAPRRRTVLVVDDEEAMREIASRVLRRAGCDVVVAANGSEALEVGGRHPGTIDLLLTDAVMPQMSGPELAERIRASQPRLRVLFMSGYSMSTITGLEGVLAGGVDLIEKPFSAEALASKVTAIFDRPSMPTNF